ncbi:MAG: hypothetical protein JJU37_15685 [Balneolaceae bacterium]|nr:hypothetical protein [Balneolaceae bacterium]
MKSENKSYLTREYIFWKKTVDLSLKLFLYVVAPVLFILLIVKSTGLKLADVYMHKLDLILLITATVFGTFFLNALNKEAKFLQLISLIRETARLLMQEQFGPNMIWEKYWSLRNQENYTEKAAYHEIEKWLLNDLEFNKEEVKKKFNITLNFESFTRSARNQ